MGLVKLFVVVSGVVLILGMVALVWLLATRERPAERMATERLVAPPTAPSVVEEAVVTDLPLPSGTVVIDMQVSGPSAALLLRSVEGVEFLAWVDLPSGKRRSLLRLVPEQP